MKKLLGMIATSVAVSFLVVGVGVGARALGDWAWTAQNRREWRTERDYINTHHCHASRRVTPSADWFDNRVEQLPPYDEYDCADPAVTIRHAVQEPTR